MLFVNTSQPKFTECSRLRSPYNLQVFLPKFMSPTRGMNSKPVVKKSMSGNAKSYIRTRTGLGKLALASRLHPKTPSWVFKIFQLFLAEYPAN
jgi:hypothetical protein